MSDFGNSNGEGQQRSSDADLVKVIWFFALLTLLGMIIVFLRLRSWQACQFELWGLACLIAGAAFGFIFAIPRPVPRNDLSGRITTLGSHSGRRRDVWQLGRPAPRSQRQLVNANLVEISDWLTKILVGVGLIELKSIPPQARRLAVEVAGESGDVSSALALIVYFSTLGFLFGYLSTRLFLAGAFSRAEREDWEREKKIRELGPALGKQVRLFTPTERPETEGIDEGPVTTEEHDEKVEVDEGPSADVNERDTLQKKLAELAGDGE